MLVGERVRTCRLGSFVKFGSRLLSLQLISSDGMGDSDARHHLRDSGCVRALCPCWRQDKGTAGRPAADHATIETKPLAPSPGHDAVAE